MLNAIGALVATSSLFEARRTPGVTCLTRVGGRREACFDRADRLADPAANNEGLCGDGLGDVTRMRRAGHG